MLNLYYYTVLRRRNILVTRREGTSVFYSVRDPVLFQVLDLLRQYFYDHLSEMRGLLEELGPRGALTAAGPGAAVE